jgi:hypothetical protein
MKTKIVIALALLISVLAWMPVPAQAVVKHRRYSHAYYVKHRSKKKQAAIIVGSAAGGALVGGLAAGPTGAVIGAGVGAGGGAIYNAKTRKKRIYR